MARINYRKYYEKCIGQKVSDDFHIHHLDSDRENNHIHNLVAIPKKLHSSYHRAELKFSDSLKILNSRRRFDGWDEERIPKYITEYMEIRNKLFNYEMQRDYLVYLNNPDLVIYEGGGLKEVERILKKYIHKL